MVNRAYVMKKTNKVRREECGFTCVEWYYSSKYRCEVMQICHPGNMGNGLDHVNENLRRLGLSSIREFQEMYPVLHEEGSPDYYYEIIFKLNN